MAQKSNKSIKIAKNYVKDLCGRVQISRAILFGSHARGDHRRDSDLDIIVISQDFKNMGFMQRLVLLSKARGQKYMTPPMDILGYTPKEFSRLKKDSVVIREANQQGVALT